MSHGVDEATYPRLHEYLCVLPDGLASYPECRSKAVLIRTAIEGHDVAALPPGLPPAVQEMIEQPPATGLWVPAVFSDAVFYAMIDTHYPTPEAVYKWTRERTFRAARSKLYRALTRVARPMMLLKMTSAVHGLFQRGTTLETERTTSTSARLRLSHPPHLHGGLNHYSNVALFEAMIEIAGGLAPRVQMIASEPTFARYETAWT
jgi:hypothetical protein